MEEKLNLNDYLSLAVAFGENPNEENFAALRNFLNKVQVREYLPLKEKEKAVASVLSTINKEFNAFGAAAYIEIAKVEKCLFQYCTNLEFDSETTVLLSTYAAYDLYHIHGLVEAIESKCEKDYGILCRMVDNAMNCSNIYRLLQTASLFDPDEYDKWLIAMEDIKDTINSENLTELLKVVGTNDEAGGDLVKAIQEMALESSKSEFSMEADKFDAASKHQKEASKKGKGDA